MLDKMNADICYTCEAAVPIAEMGVSGDCFACVARRISGGRVNPDHCVHCGLDCTPEGHDACLGTLPHPVMNACCGHGDPTKAYVQLDHENYRSDPNAVRLDGVDAVAYIDNLKESSV